MHGNAPMTPRGRMIMIERIAGGRPIAHVAFGITIDATYAATWKHRVQ